MNWWYSILIGLITAAAAGLGAGMVAHRCIGWYRISSREGQSGYFLVAMAGLGLVAGLLIGVICARLVAPSASPGFFQGLGSALLATACLLGLITLLCRMGADLPPRLEGRELAVEVEVRLPAGQTPRADPGADVPPYVSVTADSGNRDTSAGALRPAEARLESGHWIVSAVVSLQTSDSGKSLGVRLSGQETQFFRLPLPARPGREAMAWSPWMTGPTFGNLSPVNPAEAVAVRYRVQFDEPAPAATPEPE